jgi:hypothetical protein
VDWTTLGTTAATNWLVPNFLARGKSYALVAPAKEGKSLLSFDVCAALATGQPVFGEYVGAPKRVLYIDNENSIGDLTDHIVAMSYGHAELVGQFIYLLFPGLPPLDTQEGGRDLAELAEYYDPDLVVLDTVATLTDGPEDKSDTYRSLARYTMAPLKAQGRTVLRLDHPGKNGTQARGSSAKRADIDAEWHLKAARDRATVTLTLGCQRGFCHPEKIVLHRQPSTRHVLAEETRVAECARILDELGLASDIGRPTAGAKLRANGYKFGSDVISSAIKLRH